MAPSREVQWAGLVVVWSQTTWRVGGSRWPLTCLSSSLLVRNMKQLPWFHDVHGETRKQALKTCLWGSISATGFDVPRFSFSLQRLTNQSQPGFGDRHCPHSSHTPLVYIWGNWGRGIKPTERTCVWGSDSGLSLRHRSALLPSFQSKQRKLVRRKLETRGRWAQGFVCVS